MAPRIVAVELDKQGGIVLTVTGESAQFYALEASNDMVNWKRSDMKESTTGETVFSEPVTSAMRFYRAVAIP
jgi:hypothetical protein